MTDLHDVEGADSAESGLWATDALLDALAAGASVEEDRSSALLSALVADITADPVVALPQLPDRRRGHRLVPRTGIAAAAVIAVLSTGGVAAASVQAGPTSPLFPLHRVLTGQPQLDGSQRQAMEVKDKLKSAAKALASGRVTRAQQDVASAEGRLPKVAARDGHKALAAEWTSLSRQVKAKVSATPTLAPPTPVTTASPTPTHRPSPGGSTSAVPTTTLPPALTSPPVTSAGGTPTSGAPAAGAGPTTGLTTPAPTGTGSVAPSPSTGTSTSPSTSTTPSTTPSPSGSSSTGSPTVSPSVTPSKHHKPGPGSGGSPAPGSPPAPSLEPPSPTGAPITVPPASVAPVTVPLASAPPASFEPIVEPSAAPTPSAG